MKHLSIKSKVVFWYAFSMFTIIFLILMVLILAGRKAALDDARESLIISTDMAVNNVTVTRGHLIIDDDFIYYMDHTWIIVTKESGELISGLAPEGFPGDIDYQADKIRKTGHGDNVFLVYDRLIENQATGKIWIRGMTPADLSVRDPALSRIIRLFMVILPILIFLSLVGGWLITRRAFLPLRKINDTVALIQEGSDLSKRVHSGEKSPRDEIQVTAAAFDQMLDRISDSFEREKQFTNDASHELRTPVAVILAQCDYALENIDDQAEVMNAIRVIHKQTIRMSSLIDQLLLLARADRSAIIPNPELADISLLLEEAAASCLKDAEKKNIRIEVDAPEGIYIHMDRILLGRALENLLSNSIKYGKNGGVVTAIISTSYLNSSDGVSLKIRDNGKGIDEKDLDKIWNRFYRADPAGPEPGMGLGLAITKWIIEAHNGTIDVTSQPDVFTEFIIFLPF